MRRSSLVWGVILLLLGGLLLADEAGLRLPGGATPMSFFWPVLLILLGGWMILGVTMRGKTMSEQASIDLQGAAEAAVRINHGAGELRISGGAGIGQLAAGTFVGGLEQTSRRDGNRLDVRMSPPSPPFVFMPHWDRYDWDVRLNSDIPMTLDLKMGANNAIVDLTTLRVTDLKVDTGASQAQITLPSRGRMRANINLGAASLTVIVPADMAARVRVSQGVSAVRVDQSRFARTGDYYQSTGFETAENSADIHIEAGAAEINIR